MRVNARRQLRDSRHVYMFYFLICALLLTSLAAFAAPAGNSQWTAPAPKPDWVSETPMPEFGADLDSSKWGDSRWLMSDRQVRTGASTEDVFYRYAWRAITSTGISTVSDVSFSFDPSFQRLLIHGIWIHRDGERIDALRPSDLKVIQQESELDRRIYDGTLKVLPFLPDVRVGDVVEHSWTIQGRNPAFSGHHAGFWGLGYSWPVARLRLRILSGGARPLRFQHFNTELRPQTTPLGALTEYVWAQDDTRAIVYDDDRPSWVLTQPRVQVTDFESWSEVASADNRHQSPLVLPRERMPAALKEKLADWERLSTAEKRAEAAVRFVQDEIRYLGIEIGPAGYIPHDPALVYERRFGDCKDKALLLVSLLRAMGIESDVALVDTDDKHMLDQLLPSPFVFNHAIATAKVDGEQLWIDATTSLQRGPLRSRPPPDYRRALIVSDTTDSLVEIPTASLAEPGQDVTEEFTVQPDQSVLMTVTTVHRGASADSARYSNSSYAIDDATRDYLNFYIGLYEDVTSAGPVSTADDEQANIFTVREEYKLPAIWRDGGRTFEGWLVDQEVKQPAVRVRTSPLRVRHPAWLRHTIRVKGIVGSAAQPLSNTYKSNAVRFDFKAANTSDGVELTWEYRTLADHVEPTAVPAHLKVLEDIHNTGAYRVLEPQIRGPYEISSGWLWTASILMLVGVFVIYRAQKRKIYRTPEFRPGESPETAFRGTLDDAMRRLRCACGGPLARVDADLTPVQYEDGMLMAVSVICRRCNSGQTCYVSCEAPVTAE